MVSGNKSSLKLPKLIVQIPAYNESKTISEVIDSIPRKIPGIEKVEILVLDDGSKDNTFEVAKKSADHVIRNTNHPYGRFEDGKKQINTSDINGMTFKGTHGSGYFGTSNITIAGYSLTELDPNSKSQKDHDEILQGVKALSIKVMKAVLGSSYGLDELPSLIVDVLNRFAHYNSDPRVPLHGIDYLGERAAYFGGSSKIDYSNGIQIVHEQNLEDLARNPIARKIFLEDLKIQEDLYQEFVDAEKIILR